MKRVFIFFLLISLAACTTPPLTLIPVDTLVARTMAAMPKTATPVPSTTFVPAPTLYITDTPIYYFDPNSPGVSCIPASTERMRGLVTKVIDAITIEVAVENTSYLVRYIGLVAPGIMSTYQFQEVQSIAANERLVSGKVVILVKDISQTDANGLYLRYVLENNAFINYDLIRQGYTAALSSPPDTACDAVFMAAQSEAQAAQIGIWIPTPLPTLTFTSTPISTTTNTPRPTKTIQPVCDCRGKRLTCNNFRTQAAAQACFDYCKSMGYGDIFGLDKNGNGKACEGMD
jgi:endonuclease YncB( thermonuclease family)